jgi:hypothetical protein
MLHSFTATPWKFGVYVLTCSTTGMSYVGVFEGLWDKRRASHAHHAFSSAGTSKGNRPEISKAIAEHGIDAFNWTTAHVICCAAQQDAWRYEQMLIAEHQTFWPNGYNKTRGGAGTIGQYYDDERRAKNSLRMKALWAQPGRKAKFQAALQGGWKKQTQEARAKRTAKIVAGNRMMWNKLTRAERKIKTAFLNTPESREKARAKMRMTRNGMRGRIRDSRQRDLL